MYILLIVALSLGFVISLVLFIGSYLPIFPSEKYKIIETLRSEADKGKDLSELLDAIQQKGKISRWKAQKYFQEAFGLSVKEMSHLGGWNRLKGGGSIADEEIASEIKEKVWPDPFRELSVSEICDIEGSHLIRARFTPLTKFEKLCATKYLSQSSNFKSVDGKAEMIEELWEGKVPGYLWFNLGVIKNKQEVVSEKGLEEIKNIFFPEYSPSFGDIEFHQCFWIPETTVLRVRNAQAFALDPCIDGQKAWLYQVGYGDFQQRYVNFWRLHLLRDLIEKYAPDIE